MEPEPAPRPDVQTKKLPHQLAAELTPQAQDALGHPVRRQILRALNESSEPRSPGEIATAALPQASVSLVSYHARVLETCGSIAMTGTRQVPGSIACLYASKVADDERIATILEATRGLDGWVVDPQ